MKRRKQFTFIPKTTIIIFLVLFLIGFLFLIFINPNPMPPEEIKRCKNRYINFYFKGRYIDLVGNSGAAMYLKIKTDEINGYDKCFFPRFKKKGETLYYSIPLDDFYSIPFNSKGIIYKNKQEEKVYYFYQGKKYDISFFGLPSLKEER